MRPQVLLNQLKKHLFFKDVFDAVYLCSQRSTFSRKRRSLPPNEKHESDHESHWVVMFCRSHLPILAPGLPHNQSGFLLTELRKEDVEMLSQIQRFGGAMFTPVLLFPFAGIVVGLAILLQNPMFVGESLTDPNSLFAQIVHIIEEGGWTVFRNMPLIFAVGLPIGLAKQAQGRACLAVMVSFLTWNYFINAMGMTWGSYFGVDFTQDAVAGSGLTMMAGIKTLNTSIIGAIIISGIVTALHNRLFDKKLPVFLGIFQGTSYVVIIAFLVMIPCAWLTLLGWPKVQMGIESLQAFLRSAGALGVWVYTFLERILIPTGLHHFIYGPFIFGPAVVEGGIQMYWAQHLQEFSLSAEPLKSLFPEGGFALHGN
ncbi:PTS system, maltose and glucose-specific IIBC component [Shigella dysenteriae WRSd3]|uniref:PTS system, maltose and glucose-specific IIBC component n=4 Tax=Shigella dysenteriae TaxID=622 RepID=A0A090NLI9_SHIDY|nr:PTS system, maltose and glucose-specific IIBC component [Shigella dysenteriae 1617]ESU81430.1 PTS system, maltose and glucose-specific IIBC component [Shigella dysenteriae WRSd3]ESU83005.1 PTS system, maltose and glucose-specific IIBC component [Shigella dysenteriae WRSd5]